MAAGEPMMSPRMSAHVDQGMAVVGGGVDLIVAGARGALESLPDREHAWVTLRYMVKESFEHSGMTSMDYAEMVALLAIRLAEATPDDGVRP